MHISTERRDRFPFHVRISTEQHRAEGQVSRPCGYGVGYGREGVPGGGGGKPYLKSVDWYICEMGMKNGTGGGGGDFVPTIQMNRCGRKIPLLMMSTLPRPKTKAFLHVC